MSRVQGLIRVFRVRVGLTSVEVTIECCRLAEMGGVQGLAKAFRTDLQRGVYKDEVDEGFKRRQDVYGVNLFPKKPSRHFLSLCLDELKDPMLIILMVAGTISIVAGAIDDPKQGWVEGK